MTNLNDSLPWVEKYRPSCLTDIVSHNAIIHTLNNLIVNNRIPHMIFYGPPGTGKTTTILSCAKQLYGSNYRSMILELNGSDDRGINVVREQIKSFSSTSSKLSNAFVNSNESSSKYVKLVILDEADAMTYDAQFALRRVIESYTETTRFCLICNYLVKIIQPLQSRCQMFRFGPITMTEHLQRINLIIENENLNITNDAVEKIIELSDGDMRKSINLLQSINMSYKNVPDTIIDINIVYQTIGYPTDQQREHITNTIDNNKTGLANMYQTLTQIELDYNLSNQDILKEIVNHTIKKITSSSAKLKRTNMLKLLDLFENLAKIEAQLTSNTHNNIQLLAICSTINEYNI